MWNFALFEEDHFELALYQGKFDAYINDLIKELPNLSERKQYITLRYLKERFVDVDVKLLAKVLNVTQRAVYEFLKNKARYFYIPLVKGDEGILASAFVVESSKTYTNIPSVKRHLSVVKKLTGKDFFFVVDTHFTGKSFQLPLACALLVENLRGKVVFTGGLSKDGRILAVDGVYLKRQACHQRGFVLADPSKLGSLQELVEFLNKESVEVPLHITNERGEKAVSDFKDFCSQTYINIEYLKAVYELDESLLLLETGQIEDWQASIKEFAKRLWFIDTITGSRARFHISLKTASAFAFACGILHGSQKPFVIYHYQNGKYHSIPVLDVRKLKKLVEPAFVKAEFEEGSQDLCIIFNFAHHSALADVKKQTEGRCSYLVLSSSERGALPLESFFTVAQESASLIQKLRNEYSFSSYHFFFSCPVPVAFMVGVAFGHFGKGQIYNYEREEGLYKPVLSLSFLRNLREDMGKLFAEVWETDALKVI